jgi:hypothetical protein
MAAAPLLLKLQHTLITQYILLKLPLQAHPCMSAVSEVAARAAAPPVLALLHVQIQNWVAAKLHGFGNVSEVGEAINETFPQCVSKCCRPESHKDTALVLPTPACSNGTRMNNLLGLCVGGEMGYAPCPGGYSRCTLPNGVPLCLAESRVLGMDSCKVAAALMHNLPKLQCPSGYDSNSTETVGDDSININVTAEYKQ